MDDPKYLVEIASFENKRDADFAQAVLAENDIESLLKGEGDTDGVSAVFKIMVDAADTERGRKALLAINDPEMAVPEGEPVPNLNPERNGGMTSIFALLSFLLIGFVAGVVLSDKIRGIHSGGDHKEEFDWNKDGRADSWYYYSNGNLELQTYDRNFDGKIDEWLTYKDGHYAGKSEKDCNFDGRPDLFAYYDDGDIQKDEVVLDEDGIPGMVGYYEYGIIRRCEVMVPGEGRPRTVIEYDNNMRSREFLDSDGDGTFDTLVRYDRYGCFESVEKIK
ncbi:MAG TPA: DUF2007 domain-containing protein [Acidobacteriota bacterium]|nr:DUF2007 domain-containing protein [Acidobacteriota bacterium]HQO20195.1 DUF2007 domain-containing protein [Acidobacteriota bacterium]HQQ47523.1 DUF2007 domain-containing protein [Acidobacteriota bacterium]